MAVPNVSIPLYREHQSPGAQRHECALIPPYLENQVKKMLDEKEKKNFKKGMVVSQAVRKNRIESRIEAAAAPVVNEKKPVHQPQFLVYDANHRRDVSSHLLRPSSKGVYRDASAQRAYLGAQHTCDLYSQHYNRNSLDNKGMDIVSVVHYDKHMANAFWDGKEIVYGDGGDGFLNFTLDVDVIGHELTHAVTQYTVDLDYENQSGAMNESISDIFGSQVKQFSLQQNVFQADWLIGDLVLNDKPGGRKQSLRSMKAPGEAYDDPKLGKDPQPPSMDQYVNLPNTEDGDYGGVHYNSGIPNRWFYLACMALGGNSWDKVGPVVYDVMINKRVKKDATFFDFAQATIVSSQLLFKEDPKVHDAIVTAWREVKVMQ